MKIATSTGDFGRFPLTEQQKVQELYDAGFRYVDVNFYTCNKPDSWLLQDDWKEQALALKAFGEKLGVQFVQSHGPNVNALEPGENWENDVTSVIRSLEACAILGIPTCVLHMGWQIGPSKEEWFRRNKAFVEQYFPIMERTGVMLLHENSTKANMKERYYPVTGEEMAEFCDYVNHPLFGACWDTGHANCEGHQYEDLIAMGDWLKAIHFNDNRGEKDEHLMPFNGTMSMDDIMHGLLDIGYKGYFTLECESTLKDGKGWPYKRRPSTRDTRLFDVPIEIIRLQEKVLYATAKYILEQYDCFEQ